MTSHDTPVASLYASLTYADAGSMIEYLCNAFDFEKRLVVPGPEGGVVHSELSLGSAVVMVSNAKPEVKRVGPGSLDGVSHVLGITIDDPDAHYAQAKTAGATIVQELRDEEYGSRGYVAKDLEGNQWYFGTYRPGAHWDGAGAQDKP